MPEVASTSNFPGTSGYEMLSTTGHLIANIGTIVQTQAFFPPDITPMGLLLKIIP